MTAIKDIPDKLDPASNVSSDTLHTEWEEALGLSLTQEEFSEIQKTLAAFFGLLNEWDLADRGSSGEGDSHGAGSEGGDGG